MRKGASSRFLMTNRSEKTEGSRPGVQGRSSAGLCLSLSLCLLVGIAPALVPLRNYWGERVVCFSARDLAFLGASGPGAGPGVLFDSPALIGLVRRPTLELTYMADFSSEQRTRTVYDQFENAVGEAVFADNTTAAGLPGPVAVAYPVFPGLVAGAGAAPLLDFQYRYKKEYRDDFYALIGEDRVDQSGTVFLGGAGLAYRVLEWLSVGASGGYAFGERKLKVWQIRNPDTSYEYQSGNPAGVAYTGSIAAEPLDRLSLSLGFTGPVKLSDWLSSGELRSDAKLPWLVRLGLGYQAAGKLPSRALLEACYSAWQSVDTDYAGILNVRAGIEHTMLNFVKLRYGFGVEPSPFDPTVQRVGVGAGVGLDADFCVVDFGAMFRREVVGASLLRGQVTPDDQTVYQTGAVVGITLSRGF